MRHNKSRHLCRVFTILLASFGAFREYLMSKVNKSNLLKCLMMDVSLLMEKLSVGRAINMQAGNKSAVDVCLRAAH